MHSPHSLAMRGQRLFHICRVRRSCCSWLKEILLGGVGLAASVAMVPVPFPRQQRAGADPPGMRDTVSRADPLPRLNRFLNGSSNFSYVLSSLLYNPSRFSRRPWRWGQTNMISATNEMRQTSSQDEKKQMPVFCPSGKGVNHFVTTKPPGAQV